MISVILPTKDEPNVGELIASIRRELEKLGEEYEVIVVDKSSDDTPEKAKLAGAKVFKQKSDGLGNAIKEGVALAKGEIILVMDADFSHDPRHIPALLEKAKECDIVVGSRKIPGGGVVGWGLRRKLVSWAANFLARALGGIGVPDATSGYRAYRRGIFKEIGLESLRARGFEFQVEVLGKALERGLKVGVVPIVFRDRRSGRSKLSMKDILGFLSVCLNLRLRRARSIFSRRANPLRPRTSASYEI